MMPPWQDNHRLRPLPRAVDLRAAPPAWLIGCASVDGKQVVKWINQLDQPSGGWNMAIFGWINLDKLAIGWKIGSKMAIYHG